MKFFTDVTQVSFNFTDKIFNVASVFCEFSLFGRDFSIKWYGVIIAIGFTLAVLFGGRMAWVWRIDLNKMVDVLIWGTFFGIIGARGYYVLSEWEYYIQNPREIFAIWHGGLAIYGGIIGGLLGAFIYCKKAKMNFYNLLDMIGMSLLIGQGIGRWGNYANQEAFGTNTDSIFGMHSEKVARYIINNQDFFAEHNIVMDPDKPVHPTFLYESVWCITGFIILYIILKTCRKFSGQMFLLYGIWYGTGRAIIEGMRTDSLYIWNTDIRVSQALSMSIVFLCLVLLIVKIVRYKKNPQPIEGVDFFPEGSRIPKKERNKVTD
jgi:phosphatidylglycerol:prolipoprotein diacylglycerol transferase